MYHSSCGTYSERKQIRRRQTLQALTVKVTEHVRFTMHVVKWKYDPLLCDKLASVLALFSRDVIGIVAEYGEHCDCYDYHTCK